MFFPKTVCFVNRKKKFWLEPHDDDKKEKKARRSSSHAPSTSAGMNGYLWTHVCPYRDPTRFFFPNQS